TTAEVKTRSGAAAGAVAPPAGMSGVMGCGAGDAGAGRVSACIEVGVLESGEGCDASGTGDAFFSAASGAYPRWNLGSNLGSIPGPRPSLMSVPPDSLPERGGAPPRPDALRQLEQAPVARVQPEATRRIPAHDVVPAVAVEVAGAGDRVPEAPP